MKTMLIYMVMLVLMSVAFSADSYGVPPGRKIIYDGGGAGKVTFDSKDHKIRGRSCINCHPEIFIMKGNVKITMADIYADKYCGACHNGTKAFDAKKKENCAKCHK